MSFSAPPHIQKLIEEDAARKAATNPEREVAIIDYALVATDHADTDRTPAGWDGPVELIDGVRFENIDNELAERIFEATSLRGEGWNPQRQYGCIHAYVRNVWTEGADSPYPANSLHWDHDGRMYPALQLSRLVRDNASSTEFAARRIIHADGSEMLIPYDGHESRTAYRLHPDRAGWLDAEEAGKLRGLLTAYRAGHGDRVGRALNRVDRAVSERYIDDALLWVISGCEALMKVGIEALSHQFAHRVSQLATAMGKPLTYEQAERLYNSRSTHIHAAEADVEAAERDEFGSWFVALYETLRAAVCLALMDRAFASKFASDADVEMNWPLPGDDPLERGLRRVLSREGTDRFAGDATSWAGLLVKKAGADMATAVRVAQALAAIGPDQTSRGELRGVLADMGRDDLAAVLEDGAGDL